MPVRQAPRHSDTLDAQERPRILRAIVALAAVLVLGTGGLMLIQGEQWGFWESLYFTAITITTVGYNDDGLSPQGKGFTLLLLAFGIATATYAFSQMIQAAVGLGTTRAVRSSALSAGASETSIRKASPATGARPGPPKMSTPM